MGNATELIDALESAGRAFDIAQARLYEATRIAAQYVERHEGCAWGITGPSGRELWTLPAGGEWQHETYLDHVGGALTREVSSTQTAVVQDDDECGSRVHIVTTALRDDAGAARACMGVGR